MAAVGDVDGRVLDGRVAPEPGAEKLAVPGPVVEGVCGGVNADPAAATFHPAFQRGPLGLVEWVACGGQEHDRAEASQDGVLDLGGVLGRGHGEAASGAESADRGHPVVDRGVTVAGGAGEHQHREPVTGWLGR